MRVKCWCMCVWQDLLRVREGGGARFLDPTKISNKSSRGKSATASGRGTSNPQPV